MASNQLPHSNDIGNSVGPWAVIYTAWNTGSAPAAKAPVPVWQLAVLSACISIVLITVFIAWSIV